MLRRLMIATAIAGSLYSSRADAFCGFYINGSGGEMFNNATQVVLMRGGTRTVLAMQNNYQGPPSDFAMVVPVPVVLRESDVKTLSKDVFAKVDLMGSPRLVEYWEEDPCGYARESEDTSNYSMALGEGRAGFGYGAAGNGYGVAIEAKFAVGEYDIVILSAKDSTGLEHYLRDQKYKIPAGAEPLLRPYVVSGSKFFVAKVNPKKVKFESGQVMLSPLRFHYDSDEFSLPIRLGLANAKDKQDLIVNILADKRYEVANYKNVTIPTNLDVKDDVRTRFGEFYAALFDRTVEKNPGAVITEYAWDAGTCDPCPGPQLDASDFQTLGSDLVDNASFVLTRLHARYGKDGAPDDLVFRAARPIVGGRELPGANGKLEQRSRPDEINNFQARYVIRHAWTGEIECESPQRGIWGGPPDGGEPPNQGASNIAFAPRGKVQLANLVGQDVPEIGVKQDVPLVVPGSTVSRRGCGCASGEPAGGVVFAGTLFLVTRRRKRS